jgi:hypothetical protein
VKLICPSPVDAAKEDAEHPKAAAMNIPKVTFFIFKPVCFSFRHLHPALFEVMSQLLTADRIFEMWLKMED